MRVLLIDVNCKFSSTGKIVYDLYKALNNNGHIASVCYGRGPLVEENNIYKFSSTMETYVHAFLTRVTGLTGAYSPIATHQLIKYMEKFKPDIVHIHELHGYFVNIKPVINYLIKNKVKTIWTFHCEFMYTGKCGYTYDCDKWRSECGKCPLVNEYPASLYFDFTKKMFNDKKSLFDNFDNLTIVAVSKWLAGRVRKSFLKDKDIRVVYNGIDTENIFYPRSYHHLKEKHNLTDEKIVLAVAPGIFGERKGGRWVLELAKKFQAEKVIFVLIGVDDITQKFDDNVIALGRTSNQVELAEYYSMANVFVICSSKENFPTTCIEAISCGTPVCGFDEGGTKETAPGELGMFVRYGDVDALAKCVRSYLKCDAISDVCEKYGQTHYSKELMFNNYLEVYSGIKSSDHLRYVP